MAAVTRGLDAEAYDRQYSDRQLAARIGTYFIPHKRKIGIVVFAIFLLALMGAALPLIVADGVNVMTAVAEGERLRRATILVTIVFVTGVGTWLVNWLRRQLAVEVISDVVLSMRGDAFAAAARQDLSFYDEFSSGRIVSRITSDTEEFAQVATLLIDVINQAAVAIILVSYLLTIDWRLTLALVAIAPLVAVTALSFRRVARRVTRQSSRALAEVNRSIQESVTGISVAKNFRQEQAIYEGFSDVNAQTYQINIRRGLVLATIFPTLAALSGLATAGLLYLGGNAAVAGVITISAWYLFMATIDRFWFPIINISSFWSQFQAGLAASERVFALMDADPAIVQTGNMPPPLLRGEIRFEHVSFRYSTQEQVLNDFNLHIQPGESLALVGHTGAGKSSIIKLVARFYEFQEGRIFMDGIDIRDLDLNAYRHQLGIVSQVPFLFDGTVLENIQYGRPEVSEAEVLTMAQRIGDGDWLETLPDGLHSHVGERGSRLSMGQRQLVALLRVLVQKPRIFILDEATASIDPFTEAQIQQALDLIMRETTAIIIAHRLSTVRAADRILVLENGHVIEEGRHEALLAAAGHYADLYNTYFRHQSLDYVDGRQWLVEAGTD